MSAANPRDYARQCAREGVAALAHAVNACNREGATYRYSDRRKFTRIMAELVEFIERGKIESLAAPIATPTAAEHSGAFQRFLRDIAAGGPEAQQ